MSCQGIQCTYLFWISPIAYDIEVTYTIEIIERIDFKEEKIFQCIVITAARTVIGAELSLNNIFAISGKKTHTFI